jgi:iron complex transport system permease protein
VVGLGLARPLEAIALGDEMATALGARVPVIRVLAVGSITALCGGATAAVGPVAFVGLAVPHLARPLAGSSPKWTMWYALVFGPVLLLSADVAGRVVAHPGEAPVGIITALIGAPVLIALTRRGSGTR